MSEYSEDSLIEQPDVGLFEDLGWETYNGYNEFSEAADSPLLRETRGEVVLDGSTVYLTGGACQDRSLTACNH